jgi:acylphosphatase
MKQIHILISGDVQGVFFRVSTRELADKLGIKGWVRNREDGKVEILAQGDDKKLDKLIDFSKKGPIGAIVNNIVVKEENIKEKFNSFEIMY